MDCFSAGPVKEQAQQEQHVLLHGVLRVTVFDARVLHGLLPRVLNKTFQTCVPSEGCRMYATIDFERQRVARTRTIENEHLRPAWNETFNLYCAHNIGNIVVSVKDDRTVGAALLGRARVPASILLQGQPVEDWYPLYLDTGRKLRRSRVHLRMDYLDVTQDKSWGRGLLEANSGVPNTYFQQHKGCKVTLYQDAHAQDGFLPRISLQPNVTRQPTRCWSDVLDAIDRAMDLVYITGWSVNTQIKLLREPLSRGVTLGELLKKKAQLGVQVLLLVWDDRTSVSYVKKEGLMATHDEDTLAYFQGTRVHCVLCPRNPDQASSLVQGFQIGTLFTHHQKSISVDAPGLKGGDKRRIVSFIGGIDLCDGRYDTQSHPLFRTLATVHRDDFHQPNYSGASIQKGGPREPWHDIHSKLEGPVAWDVVRNFEQRWMKQGGQKNLLVSTESVTGSPSPVVSENDLNSWNVQLFRSIDDAAAAGLPQDPKAAAESGLITGKNRTMDRSIQDAYIHAIRRARNFIYIENQYFLGSSFAWDSDQDAEASHLIPQELVLKIVSKIKAGERFAVYIVLPMWPEGIPESPQVQAILDWQKKTMEMMYKAIAQALMEKRMTNVSARDYLTFFCLGNRETSLPGEPVPRSRPELGTGYRSAQDRRRFMIYVHSKMMIVDDEYIIVGSANINQRSMDGGRDTEIAMGAYQPATVSTPGPPGEVHAFRMSLWYEHLNKMHPSFLQPWSLECIRTVNATAEELWTWYAGNKVVDLAGHLLAYPVQVTPSGSIHPLVDCSKFPDTDASILGAKSAVLPAILTT